MVDKTRYKALELLNNLSNDNSIFPREYLSAQLQTMTDKSVNKSEIFSIVLGVRSLKDRYDYILSDLYNGNYTKLKIQVKNILRIGCYIHENHSTPNHAAVSSCVDICKYSMKGLEKLVNALLRKYISVSSNFVPLENNIDSLQLLSHPKWMLQRWIESFGFDKTKDICEYNNKPPSIWFRIDDKMYIERIKDDINGEINFHELNDKYFKTSDPKSVIESSLFSNGILSVQNPINGYIADMLTAKKDEVIIDGCSAPGGKGIYISRKFSDSKIFSIELNRRKLELIEQNIKRMSIKNIEILMLDMTNSALPEANTILIDVPCSGTGSIQRRGDIKWGKTLDDVIELTSIQSKIIENSKKYLKVGGSIVYSTCSIEYEENYKIIETFLNNNRNFKLEDAADYVPSTLVKNKCIDVLPGTCNLDGGFAAKITKVK